MLMWMLRTLACRRWSPCSLAGAAEPGLPARRVDTPLRPLALAFIEALAAGAHDTAAKPLIVTLMCCEVTLHVRRAQWPDCHVGVVERPMCMHGGAVRLALMSDSTWQLQRATTSVPLSVVSGDMTMRLVSL